MIAPQPGTPRTIYVQWSDDGQRIRKWSLDEFGFAEQLPVEAVLPDPKAQALADALREAAIDAAASLAAAISLLEGGGKAAKRAASSDRMFDAMVADYQASLERARQALAAWDAKP